nr:hypothetical protein [Tanacetum cinerariifolium]
MLNKENYVPWSSRLLLYAKSRPNGKLIHNSILNGPYVRKMIPEPGDANREITTILLGLPEDIYATVDSCETAQEIWLRVQQMMKGSDIGIQEKKAKLFNEWEMFTSNEGESIESYYHRFLKLMNDLKRNKHFPKKIASNLKSHNCNEYGTRINGKSIQAKLLNTNQQQSNNFIKPEEQANCLSENEYGLRQTNADGWRVQNVRNQNDLIGVQGNGNQNQTGNGNLMAARAEGNAAGQNRNQIRCYNCRGTDSAPVYDTDRSAEVHENCDDNEIFNMFIQKEQYTELLKPIPESHQVPQNDNDVIYEDTSMEQEKKKLKSDFKTCEDELLDKQIQLEKKIKELNNILLKTGQSIQTIHMLSLKPNSFYHTEQKMALGYQNPFYLKQAQKKQQSLYDGKVLLEKHDPPVVHDSEETLQLAQESRVKMKQMNKEIKPTNYTKISHLSGVFVPQTALSREELYFSNNSKMVNVSKSISIPNEDFLDDTTPSVALKFLNGEAAKFVGDFKSLANKADASLAKQKALELEIKRLLKAIVSQDIMIIMQNESVIDTSDLQTVLEHTKEHFENCIIKKETEYAKLWNGWYKMCDECKYDKISYDTAYKDMQQKIERLQAQLGDLKGKSKDSSSVSDTHNPLSQKLENENVELEFQVLNYARENAHLKATYKNLFDSISVS